MAREKKFRLPGPTHRTAVIGRTGSGKSQLGAWLLSHQNFDKMPWVIVDYKGEELLNSISRVKEIGFETPKQPGLYKIHPGLDQDVETDNWLKRIWAHGKIGLFIDEAFVLPSPRGGGFEAILTQGRSLRLPVIALSQRPVDVSKYVFTQADFLAVFHVPSYNDRKTVENYAPKGMIDLNDRLEDYCSTWYDVGQNKVFELDPVPDADDIIEAIEDRLKPKRTWLKG